MFCDVFTRFCLRFLFQAICFDNVGVPKRGLFEGITFYFAQPFEWLGVGVEAKR